MDQITNSKALPQIKGSEKQIAWAQDILNTYFKAMQDLPEYFISRYEYRVKRDLPEDDKSEILRAAKAQEEEDRRSLNELVNKNNVTASRIIDMRNWFAPENAIKRVLTRANMDGNTIELAVGTGYGLFANKTKEG
nr:MAG TPA: hypothetical protein [Caudoviricetes sp.]